MFRTWIALLLIGFFVYFAQDGFFILCRYLKLVEGGLGNHAPLQEGSRSPLKYVIINDETVGTFELEDDIDHVL